MANPSKILSLEILDREYRVNCPDGAEYELREAARALDEKLHAAAVQEQLQHVALEDHRVQLVVVVHEAAAQEEGPRGPEQGAHAGGGGWFG